MLVGVPKEIKVHEYRVGLTPASVRELTEHGHDVVVQTGAGKGIGFSDQDYEQVGAVILGTAQDVYQQAEMIVKVKEPLAEERKLIRSGQTLFTYLHLAPDTAQTQDLLDSGAICIAYETVTDNQGRLPLLAPMSEVAGRMSVQAGAHCLEKYAGGRGLLLGGVPGVEPAKVCIIGAGVVGRNALAMAVGLGADVTVLDRNVNALRALDDFYGNRIKTLMSNREHLDAAVLEADLVIGGVLIPGAAAPKLVTRAMVKEMKPGSVLVDVAIDQGGCFETSHPTTHQEPTFIVNDVVHYCVANMPGAVARTSTFALNNATLPFVLALADNTPKQAMEKDRHLLNGLAIANGQLICPAVAEAQQREFVDRNTVIKSL